jgi:hypothetical protein
MPAAASVTGFSILHLRGSGAERIRLTTGSGTPALTFYEKRGRRRMGPAEHGDIRLELEKPTGAG